MGYDVWSEIVLFVSFESCFRVYISKESYRMLANYSKYALSFLSEGIHEVRYCMVATSLFQNKILSLWHYST